MIGVQCCYKAKFKTYKPQNRLSSSTQHHAERSLANFLPSLAIVGHASWHLPKAYGVAG
jgi:hypothetical protein